MGMVSRFMGRDLVPFITAQKTWAIVLPAVAHFLLDKDLLSYINGIRQKGKLINRDKNKFCLDKDLLSYISGIIIRKD